MAKVGKLKKLAQAVVLAAGLTSCANNFHSEFDQNLQEETPVVREDGSVVTKYFDEKVPEDWERVDAKTLDELKTPLYSRDKFDSDYGFGDVREVSPHPIMQEVVYGADTSLSGWKGYLVVDATRQDFEKNGMTTFYQLRCINEKSGEYDVWDLEHGSIFYTNENGRVKANLDNFAPQYDNWISHFYTKDLKKGQNPGYELLERFNGDKFETIKNIDLNTMQYWTNDLMEIQRIPENQISKMQNGYQASDYQQQGMVWSETNIKNSMKPAEGERRGFMVQRDAVFVDHIDYSRDVKYFDQEICTADQAKAATAYLQARAVLWEQLGNLRIVDQEFGKVVVDLANKKVVKNEIGKVGATTKSVSVPMTEELQELFENGNVSQISEVVLKQVAQQQQQDQGREM